MNRKWLVSVVGCLAMGSLLVVVGSAQETLQGVAAVGDTSCQYTFAYTQNNGLTWCLSGNGNIMMLRTPSTPFSEHIRVGTFTEGYAICDATGGSHIAYDYGSIASGFGTTTVISGCVDGALPCTMQRDTTDGHFQLKMAFNSTPGDREITITETIENLRNIHTDTVELWRFADVDVNASTGNDLGDRSRNSAWARDIPPGQRVGLSALTHAVLSSTNILGATPPTNHLCSTSDPGPLPHSGDVGIFVSSDFDLGLGALKSRTVRFQYRVD